MHGSDLPITSDTLTGKRREQAIAEHIEWLSRPDHGIEIGNDDAPIAKFLEQRRKSLAARRQGNA